MFNGGDDALAASVVVGEDGVGAVDTIAAASVMHRRVASECTGGESPPAPVSRSCPES